MPLYKQQRKIIVCDAAFDPKSKKAYIGYISSCLKYSHTESLICNNINDAEYKAIELALKDFPNEDIRSDNDTAVNKFRNEHKKLNVSFIGRQWNIANTIVRSAMEISKAKSPNKF